MELSYGQQRIASSPLTPILDSLYLLGPVNYLKIIRKENTDERFSPNGQITNLSDSTTAG